MWTDKIESFPAEPVAPIGLMQPAFYGDLNTPIDGAAVQCPYAVDIRANRLVFTYRDRDDEWTALGARVLPEFLALNSDRAALRFALRYGPLGLCAKHFQPFTHRNRGCAPQRRRNKGVQIIEPLPAWSNWLLTLRYLAEAAAGPALDKTQKALAAIRDSGMIPRATSVAATLNILFSNVQSRFYMTAAQRVRLQFIPPLFGQLVFALAFNASNAQGLAFCSACGTPFVPKRKPNPNRRVYCQACGRQASWRDAKRRARQAQEGGRNNG